MPAPLLLTKLYIPLARPNLVLRPHLLARLNEGLTCKLTLVSAPAGFGKTTLVSEWLANVTQPVAWLSLDERDRDPTRFLAYLVAALQGVSAKTGKEVLAALESPQPPSIDAILTSLLNDLTAVQGDFILVLDDYHTLDSKAVDQALAFLIEHQPPQMHLVLTTREDPSLPLARYRARGQLSELRAADLRFTPAEAADFLNRVMRLNLSAEDIALLETRTEGWIAGLQLAALSMQGHSDVSQFIQAFTGSHHFVLDYLVAEVLEKQPERIQNFLLRSSILDRLCGPLCDAVAPSPAAPGQETLEFLERANLFIVPLDNERRWYRYHHLFGNLLHKRLGQAVSPGEVDALHLRASEWFEDNNLLLDAFRHAAAAHDVERAGRLMESKQMPLHLRGTATTILGWLETLPDSVRKAHPALWWKQASLRLAIGQTTGVEEILQAAEAALDANAIPGAEPDEMTRDLVGKIAVTRASLAQTQAQVDIIFVQARRALERLHPDNLSYRSSATRLIGFAHYWQEDWGEAFHAYREALSLAQTAGDISNEISALIGLGQVQDTQSQLHLAVETYQRVLKLTGDYSPPNSVTAYLGLAQIFYQWNDLDAAEQYSQQGLQLAQQYAQITDRVVMSELYLALIKLARSDLDGAAQMVSQADQTSRQKSFTLRLPNITYFQVWILLRQGNLAAAAQIAWQHELPLMQARVLIAQGDLSAALAVLEPLRRHVETAGWPRRLIDVMTVQSVALYLHGEKEKAVKILEKVLEQAEPEGFIRLFVDEGKPMEELLSTAAAQSIRPGYTSKLLAAFRQERPDEPPATAIPGSGSLIEPLSPRELEVLRLIAQGLSNQEICQRLFLALDTVKGHNRRIYDKLQVQRRTEAIARARELGLI